MGGLKIPDRTVGANLLAVCQNLNEGYKCSQNLLEQPLLEKVTGYCLLVTVY